MLSQSENIHSSSGAQSERRPGFSSLSTVSHLPLGLRLKLAYDEVVKAGCGGHMLLTPALGRQRQADLYDSEASLIYIVSCRSARGYIVLLCLK